MAGKALAVGVGIVALAAAGWFLLRPPAQPTSRPLTAADRVAPRPAPVKERDRPPVEEAATGLIPPPVELAKCDRDLDLFGKVVNEAGAPVPGALLEVLQDLRSGFSVLRHAADVSARVDEASRSASDGTFRFRLRRGAVRDLRTTAPGFAETLLPNCLAGERLRVVLRHGGGFVVIARNEKHEPVEGAFVRINRSVEGGENIFERTGTTDAGGRCAFERLVPGRINYVITHSRYVKVDGGFSAVPRTGIRTLEVVLSEGTTVYGTVRDAATGAAVAGARVFPPWEPHRAFLSDEEGRFAYPGWQPIGTSFLMVEAEGYSTGSAMVAPGAAAEVLLAAEDVAEGRVVDGKDAPVPGALVTLFGLKGKGSDARASFRNGLTGPDGRFRIRGLRHDMSHRMVVRAEGHGLLLREISSPFGGAGTIALGMLILPGGASLQGTVFDAQGKPLPAFAVRLEGPLGALPEEMQSLTGEELRSDDLGRFRFHDMAPGKYRVFTYMDRYGPEPVSAEATLAEGEDARGIDLHLTWGGSLRVLVVDPSGEPVPGTHVIVSLPDKKWLYRWSDVDGRVTIMGLPPGKVTLQASVFQDSGMGLSASERTEPLDPDGSEVTLTLRSVGVVKGKVVDGGGAGVAGVEVRVTTVDGNWSWLVVSDSAGEFLANPPLGGPVDLLVNGTIRTDPLNPNARAPSKWRAEAKAVPVPSEGVVLRVGAAPLRPITVRLVDPEGNPVPGVRVLEWLHSPPPNAVTGADGRARFEELLTEESQFGIFGTNLPEGCVSPTSLRAVPDGQEVVLTLRRGVPFTGTVLRANGTPAAGAQVSADAIDGTASFGTTDAEGKFRVFILPGTPLKEVSASLETGDHTGEGVRVKDVDPEAGPLTLRLEPVER